MFFVPSLHYYAPHFGLYTILYRPSRLRKERWLVCLLDGEEDTCCNIVRYGTIWIRGYELERAGVSLWGAMSESRGEAKGRKDYKNRKKEEDMW